MLYVSRRIGNFSYGVVDTDDGTEEVVKKGDIVEAVNHLGVKIEGFDAKTKKVHIYQPEDTLTQLQVRARVLKHLDIKIYGSMITCIKWNPAEIKHPVSIKLSDFGRFCADRILMENEHAGHHTVTLVFDDGIVFKPDAFWLGHALDASYAGVDGYGVLFDLRLMTENELVWWVYRVLFDDARKNLSKVANSILDSDSRKAQMLEFLREDEFRSWDDILKGRHPTWEKN